MKLLLLFDYVMNWMVQSLFITELYIYLHTSKKKHYTLKSHMKNRQKKQKTNPDESICSVVHGHVEPLEPIREKKKLKINTFYFHVI